jgi:membrane protease YdiL (CAAX protease family)
MKIRSIFRPADPPPVFHPSWGPWMASVWALVIFIVTLFAPLAARDLGLVVVTLPDGRADPHAFEAITAPLMILGLLVVASRFRSNPLDVLALRRPASAKRVIAIVLITLVAMILIVAVAVVVAEESGVTDPNQKLNEATIHRTGLLTSLLFTGLIGPVKEEMLFRGFLLVSFFNTRLWFWSAAAITSLAFALLHNVDSVNVLLILPYFVMGLGFAAALRFTGSLWVSIGLHVLKNTLAVLSVSLL